MPPPPDALSTGIQILGLLVIALVTIIGLRLLFYFDSFFFHWREYRQREPVTNDDLAAMTLPAVKVQITTRGSAGSTRVVARGIGSVIAAVRSSPAAVKRAVSVEVITESAAQARRLRRKFAEAPISVDVQVLPADYRTPKGTQLKARALHYMVEKRRRGWNRSSRDRTFIVHYDEESVFEPSELRRLLRVLATTTKRVLEGPIYYPLDYHDAGLLCRAMEAQRPVACFECRDVMESGVPLHLHGSNLVVDEALENEVGWDIGNLDGQPFIAEDYVFGALVFTHYGWDVFGWHGCVMLEQPPFSVRSAFRQRYRWILGVLQGVAMVQRLPEAEAPSTRLRHLVWGTRFRVATFALGLPAGVLSVFYLISQAALVLMNRGVSPLALPVVAWLAAVGFLWINVLVIGAWCNVSLARQLSWRERIAETISVISVAPIAGMVESAAGFLAVMNWVIGRRTVTWLPTPKSARADREAWAAAGR